MRVSVVVVCCIILVSCLNNKAEKEKGVGEGLDPQTIFHDYRISADEERENVTILLQYRDGEDGGPLALDDAFQVKLDGVTLQPDSARLSGAFYEAQKPSSQFQGTHTINLVDAKGKQHKAEFDFQPFTLAEEIPKQLSKKPFAIRLADFPDGETKVHLVMIDTSFASPDINEEVDIENGEIRIGNDKLANLALGPVNLEIQFEQNKPLRKISREGGRILISYSLRRQFELTK